MTATLHRRAFSEPKSDSQANIIDVSATVDFGKDRIFLTKIYLYVDQRDLSAAKGAAFASCEPHQLEIIADLLMEIAAEARAKHAVIRGVL